MYGYAVYTFGDNNEKFIHYTIYVYIQNIYTYIHRIEINQKMKLNRIRIEEREKVIV